MAEEQNKEIELEKETDTEAQAEDTDTVKDAGTEEATDTSEETDAEKKEADGEEEEADTAENDSENAEASEEKKGFFKKKEKKNKQDERIAELTDQVKRQMAEFDNFRKRTEKEKAAMFEVGAKSVIEKILPVIDNFERGLAAVPQGSENDAFVEGMNKIYKQLITELESLDVKPIEAVGTEFDPEYHNAVMQVESEEYESGVVAQELLKGYMYRDSVVRHSMVAVVQ